MAANEMGRVAVRWAQVMRNEVDVAVEEIAAVRGGAGQVLRLGALSVTSVVPAAIVALREALPGVVVHIREGAVDVLVERLLAGELDCVVGALAPALLGGTELKNLSLKTIIPDSLCVVAAPLNRFARLKRLSWAQLQDEPWVLPPGETMVRQAFVAAYMQLGMRAPEAAVETLSPITLSSLVRTDQGLLGVMRAEQVRGERAALSLVRLPVTPTFALASLSLFTRRARSKTPPLVEAFYEALKMAASAAPPD